MNLGAGQPAIPPLGVEPLVLDEDLFLLAMSRALDNTLPSIQSKLQSVIHNVFEQFRLTTPPPARYQQRPLEQSSTPISDPKTQIEIVHSHLWKARSKQVALKSTAATGGVKKRHRSRLGTYGSLATDTHPKRKVSFQRLVAEIAQDVKVDWRSQSSVVPSLLGSTVSTQVNNTHASFYSVSNTGTLSFVNNGCGAVDSVFVGSIPVGVRHDNQGPNSGEKGGERHALQLLDEMSQSYGLCDAGNNIVGYMGIRDKGGGLASHCTFVEYYQLPEKKTATDHLDCKPYVVHNDLGSKEKSASAVAHSEAFTGVHGILELGYCRLNYFGKGILKAEGNVNGISGPALIGPALIDNDPREQIQVDDYMVQQLERIRNEWGWSKQEFGENIISAVSLYVRKAGANLTGNKTLILHVPTKFGNSFKLTFSLIIALIELWKYGYVEKNMRWFTGNLVASFINGCLTFQHDYKHISCGIKFNSFLVNGYDERIVFYCFKVLQMMDKWQLYVEVVYKGLSHVIHTSLNLKAVVDLSLCATTECGTVALKVWLSGNLLYLLLGSKLEKLSWFFAVKLEKWEGNAKMMFDKYWERWLSLLVAANECSAGGSLKWFRERDLPLLLLSLSRELANGDIWGIARLDFGLMNYVGAMCRDGVHDTIFIIKDVMILWVLHVNGMVQGSFHHLLRWELMKKGWQLQLFLPRVITHEMGEAFTTWELILARGGYSNWECSGTQDNEGDDRLVVDNEDVRAVVLHNDGLMIVEDDIADGDKESNISLLQHIFVHLQGLSITDLKLLIIQHYLSSYTFFLALGLICVSTCSRYISADIANRRGFQMTSCKGAQILIQNVKLEVKFV